MIKPLIQFVEEYWETLEPGTDFRRNWHHEIICKALTIHAVRIMGGVAKKDAPNEIGSKDLIINVPPRSTKSRICTVFFPAWVWSYYPTMKFVTASYSSKLALKHARETRTIFRSEKYIQEFGPPFEMAVDQDTKSDYENTVGGARFAVGMTGSATGSGGDILIVDDPLNPLEAASEVEREKANTIYKETLYNRTTDPNTMLRVIIMQRLHEDDLTGHLLKNAPGKYFHICLPAEASDLVSPPSMVEKYKDGLLWPEWFGRDVLEDFKVSLGPYAYAGQVEQNPSPGAGGLIERDWFKIIDGLTGNPTINFKIDAAYTEKEAGDATAILAYVQDGDEIIVTNCVSVRFEFHRLCEFINAFAIENGYDERSKIAVEPKAGGKDIVSVLRNATALNVVEDFNPTKDKTARVRDIQARLAAGRCKLVRGPWNEEFIAECTMFPKAKHDDKVDTLVMAMNETNKIEFFAR